MRRIRKFIGGAWCAARRQDTIGTSNRENDDGGVSAIERTGQR